MELQFKAAAATVGCKVNFCDSSAILQTFADCGYEIVDFDSKADVYIINTCTVTNTGDKKSRQMISRARAKNPLATVAVVGCYAQLDPAGISALGADIIMGTKDRDKLAQYVRGYKKYMGCLDLVSKAGEDKEFEPIFVERTFDRARAFLKIQDGCDNFCAYCIVPYARGRSRSRRPQDIILQAKTFAKNGYQEIVICGIHIAGFGKDLGGVVTAEKDCSLLRIIKSVCEIDGIRRIRLSSVEPNVITPEFVEMIKQSDKICPHFHLPLQTGSDRLLAQMGRRYTTADYSQSVRLLRENIPDVSITSDIIVGLPGESDEDFEATLRCVCEMELSGLHVFPYSVKKGTKAAQMDRQTPHHVKTARAKEMRELGDKLSRQFLEKFAGRRMDVLVEQKNKAGKMEGKTANYINVAYDGDEDDINQIVGVELVEMEKIGFLGKTINK